MQYFSTESFVCIKHEETSSSLYHHHHHHLHFGTLVWFLSHQVSSLSSRRSVTLPLSVGPQRFITICVGEASSQPRQRGLANQI